MNSLSRQTNQLRVEVQAITTNTALRSARRSGLDAVLEGLKTLNPIGAAQAQKGGPGDGARRSAGPLSDPLAAARMDAYNTAVARIRQLNPGYDALTRPGFAPNQEMLDSTAKNAVRNPSEGRQQDSERTWLR